MKIFDPVTPLLKSVDFAIRSTGGPGDYALRRDGRETLSVSWFPSLPNGQLAYDEDENAWEQGEGSTEDENLMIHISSNGDLEITSGEGEALYLRTAVKAGDELEELLEFYVTALASMIGFSSCNRKPLAQLIDEVFLLIPQKEGHPQLLPLRGQQFSKALPEVAAMVDSLLSQDFEANAALGGYWDFGQWLDDRDQRGGIGETEPLRLGDLILSGFGGIHYAGMLMAEADSNLGFAPEIVLRPSAGTSRMWLKDYFDHSIEADGLVARICKGWKHLPKGLERIDVPIPATKRDQVASTIERRTARSRYLGYLESAMKVREPFDQITTIYNKRTRAAKGLHTELLDDLVAIQHPLPFFLEYPFHVFRREDDHIRKVRAGQRLLGTLAKVPLYLVIEELLSAQHSLGTELMDKLAKEPPSDGTLVSLHAEVVKRLANESKCPLVVFKSLLGFLGDNTALMKIVSARNRMHHEPYDEVGFLKEMNERVPVLFDSLREVLHGCRFLVPSHSKVAGGKRILTAEDACGTDAQFRIVDLTVSLPLEVFPSGELIAYRESPEQVLVLGKLLVAKMVTRQSRDFGVFDRMEKNEPQFTYLRSE